MFYFSESVCSSLVKNAFKSELPTSDILLNPRSFNIASAPPTSSSVPLLYSDNLYCPISSNGSLSPVGERSCFILSVILPLDKIVASFSSTLLPHLMLLLLLSDTY